ncbi:MAG: hypothetical protein RL563_2672 [Pseudomonadota bacterium]|jgi:flagellar biosynthesis/type III secretory pathway protein FliH
MNAMTKDDIIQMAREAEVPVRGHYDEQGLTPEELERFAALAYEKGYHEGYRAGFDNGDSEGFTRASDLYVSKVLSGESR